MCGAEIDSVSRAQQACSGHKKKGDKAHKKKGDKLFAPMPNKIIKVEITNPVFIDPNNERLSV